MSVLTDRIAQHAMRIIEWPTKIRFHVKGVGQAKSLPLIAPDASLAQARMSLLLGENVRHVTTDL